MLQPSKTKVLLLSSLVLLTFYVLAYSSLGRWGLLMVFLFLALHLFLLVQAPVDLILNQSGIHNPIPLLGELDSFRIHQFVQKDLLFPPVAIYCFASERTEAFVFPRFRFQSKMYFSSAWLERFNQQETQIAAEILSERLKYLSNPLNFLLFRIGLCFFHHGIFLKSLPLQTLFVPTILKFLGFSILNRLGSAQKILQLDRTAKLNELQRNQFCTLFSKALHINLNLEKHKSSLPNLLQFSPHTAPSMGALRERSLALTGSFPHG